MLTRLPADLLAHVSGWLPQKNVQHLINLMVCSREVYMLRTRLIVSWLARQHPQMPLLFACKWRLPDVINALMQTSNQDQKDRTLIEACYHGWRDVARYMLKLGAHVQAQNNLALMQAARNGHTGVLEDLLAHGANVHSRHDTAITITSILGFVDATKLLLANGAQRAAMMHGRSIRHQVCATR